MAKNEGKRLSSAKLKVDADGFDALQRIENYSPIHASYTTDAVRTAFDALRQSRAVEVDAAKAAAVARENAIAEEWRFHNLMLCVKEQVIAQFGKDSIEVEALGLKRKSEYKPPRRRSAGGNSAS